jgi:hypothetical protein
VESGSAGRLKLEPRPFGVVIDHQQQGIESRVVDAAAIQLGHDCGDQANGSEEKRDQARFHDQPPIVVVGAITAGFTKER